MVLYPLSSTCWDYGHELSHPEATEVLYVQSDTMTHGYEWTSHAIFLEEGVQNGPREHLYLTEKTVQLQSSEFSRTLE